MLYQLEPWLCWRLTFSPGCQCLHLENKGLWKLSKKVWYIKPPKSAPRTLWVLTSLLRLVALLSLGDDCNSWPVFLNNNQRFGNHVRVAHTEQGERTSLSTSFVPRRDPWLCCELPLIDQQDKATKTWLGWTSSAHQKISTTRLSSWQIMRIFLDRVTKGLDSNVTAAWMVFLSNCS